MLINKAGLAVKTPLHDPQGKQNIFWSSGSSLIGKVTSKSGVNGLRAATREWCTFKSIFKSLNGPSAAWAILFLKQKGKNLFV